MDSLQADMCRPNMRVDITLQKFAKLEKKQARKNLKVQYNMRNVKRSKKQQDFIASHPKQEFFDGYRCQDLGGGNFRVYRRNEFGVWDIPNGHRVFTNNRQVCRLQLGCRINCSKCFNTTYVVSFGIQSYLKPRTSAFFLLHNHATMQ